MAEDDYGVLEVPRIDETLRHQIEQRLLGRTVEAPSPQATAVSHEDPQVVDVWRGSQPSLRTGFTGIDITLARPAAGEGQPEDQFTVSVKLDANGALLKSSLPGSAHLLNGAPIARRLSQPRREFFVGRGDSSFVLLQPKQTDDGMLFALCPRIIQRSPFGGVLATLADPGYRLREVRIQADAKASGRYPTGLDIGYAKARILTSPTLVSSVPYFDEAYAMDVSVDVNYLPRRPAEAVVVGENGATGAAIAAEVVQHNAAGYRLAARQTSELRAVELLLDASLPVQVRNRALALGRGHCVALLTSRNEVVRYDRAPFQRPDD